MERWEGRTETEYLKRILNDIARTTPFGFLPESALNYFEEQFKNSGIREQIINAMDESELRNKKEK